MALDVKSCNAMIAAAAKSRGKLMIAQCLRFAPAVKYLHDVVASGKYGKVVGASFDRASMLPGWGAGGKSWFLDEEASGGVLLDLHIHDVDFINWTFGRPKSVVVRRHVRPDGVTDRATTLYGYDNCVVSSSASWAASPSFSFEARSFVELEKATIVMDAKRAAPLQVYIRGNHVNDIICPQYCRDQGLRRLDARPPRVRADNTRGRARRSGACGG